MVNPHSDKKNKTGTTYGFAGMGNPADQSYFGSGVNVKPKTIVDTKAQQEQNESTGNQGITTIFPASTPEMKTGFGSFTGASSGSTGSSPLVQETLRKIFQKAIDDRKEQAEEDKVGLAFRFIRKRYSRTYYGTNNIFTMSSHSRISAARGLAKRFYWLYGKDTEDKDYPSNRNGNYGGDYFIPASRNETDDMTLDFFVSELVQAGYKASSIVQAVKNKGNMKGRVSFRVITFKDPNKEDKVGYRLKK